MGISHLLFVVTKLSLHTDMPCIKHGQLPDNLVMHFLQPLATVTSKCYPPIYVGTQIQHMIMLAVAPPVSVGVDCVFPQN